MPPCRVLQSPRFLSLYSFWFWALLFTKSPGCVQSFATDEQRTSNVLHCSTWVIIISTCKVMRPILRL